MPNYIGYSLLTFIIIFFIYLIVDTLISSRNVGRLSVPRVTRQREREQQLEARAQSQAAQQAQINYAREVENSMRSGTAGLLGQPSPVRSYDYEIGGSFAVAPQSYIYNPSTMGWSVEAPTPDLEKQAAKEAMLEMISTIETIFGSGGMQHGKSGKSLKKSFDALKAAAELLKP